MTHQQPPTPDQPSQYVQPIGPRRAARWPWLLAAGFVVFIIALAVFASRLDGDAGDGPLAPGATADTFTIRGTLTLKADVILPVGERGCAGARGYDDIRPGASVTVYDPSGTIIATGIAVRSTLIESGTYIGDECILDLEVANVPAGHAFYSIEVSRRGKVTVTADDARNGRVALTLG